MLFSSVVKNKKKIVVLFSILERIEIGERSSAIYEILYVNVIITPRCDTLYITA